MMTVTVRTFHRGDDAQAQHLNRALLRIHGISESWTLKDLRCHFALYPLHLQDLDEDALREIASHSHWIRRDNAKEHQNAPLLGRNGVMMRAAR